MVSPDDLVEGKYTVRSLMETAQKVVERKTGDSKLLDRDAEDRIPKFQKSEMSLGKVLGRGGFCVVKEVSAIKLLKTEETNNDSTVQMDDEHAIHNVVQDRNFMATHCLRGKGKDARYALKQVQDSSRNDAQTYINGVVDLAIEARFLSVVRHPNIIKMRAMNVSSPYSIDSPFFVVLDRLYDIMGQRLIKWKKQKPTGMKKLLDRKGRKEMAFWLERMTVAYDLSLALQHLHEMHIVYRDIKPDNIGFDVRGDVKIFDFGLAKEIDPTKKDHNGMYNLTGDTGSPRYMAYEVALNQPYNETCDVYSFVILLWQMLELSTPFEGFTMSMFSKKVVQGGARPKCDPKWPNEIQDLMKRGWGEPKNRPSMSDVADTLRDEINRNSDEGVATNSGEFMDASRKSELSLRGSNNGRYIGRSELSARALSAMRKK